MTNGFKAAPLSPDRLFIQQLLHWRKEKDEENERKAKEKAEEEALLNEEPTIDVRPHLGKSPRLGFRQSGTGKSPTGGSDPTDSDEEVPKVRHYKRMVPKDWKPNQKHIDRANELNIDVNTEAEKFYNYSHSNGKKYLDFDRAFDNWLLNADKFNRNGQSRRKTRSEEGYEHNMNMLKESLAQAGWMNDDSTGSNTRNVDHGTGQQWQTALPTRLRTPVRHRAVDPNQQPLRQQAVG